MCFRYDILKFYVKYLYLISKDGDVNVDKSYDIIG